MIITHFKGNVVSGDAAGSGEIRDLVILEEGDDLVLGLVGEEKSALVTEDLGHLVQLGVVFFGRGLAQCQGHDPVLAHEEFRMVPRFPELFEGQVPHVLHGEDETSGVIIDCGANLVDQSLFGFQTHFLLGFGQTHSLVTTGFGHDDQGTSI